MIRVPAGDWHRPNRGRVTRESEAVDIDIVVEKRIVGLQGLLFSPESHERVDLGRGEIAVQFRTVRLRLLYGRFSVTVFSGLTETGVWVDFEACFSVLAFLLARRSLRLWAVAVAQPRRIERKRVQARIFLMMESEIQVEVESESRAVSADGRGIDVIHRRRELYA